MNNRDFNGIVKRRLKKCEVVLVKKEGEYARESDRLYNFKRAGMIRKCCPIEALDGMMIKHIVSFRDIIEGMIKNPSYVPTQELIDEKFGDVINYILLLEGLIEERRGQGKQLVEEEE